MPKHGKSYRKAAEAIEPRPYPLPEAVELAKAGGYAKFDETMEMAVRLGVDPRHADQMVRGTVALPHGTGRELRLLVFASGEKIKEAEEAGADYAGGEELAKKIEDGWLDFDAVVATPDMMKVAGKLGRVLGPRGMMPNPKAGKIEFRVDKTAIVHAAFGKSSFSSDQLRENAEALLGALVKARPAAAKGKYIRSVSISSTMGPGVRVDESSLVGLEA